jgi:hypothetical protein
MVQLLKSKDIKKNQYTKQFEQALKSVGNKKTIKIRKNREEYKKRYDF